MTKTGIKNAAFRLFAEKGYDATTMNDIAEVVGIKKPSIYVHYVNKSDILNSILQEQYSIVSLKLESIHKENRNKEICSALKMVFLDVVDFFSDKANILFWKRMLVGYYSDLNIDDGDSVTDIIEKIRNEIYITISRLCLEYQSLDQDSINVLIHYFYQFTSGFLDVMMSVPEKELEQKVEQSWNLFCNGVKGQLKTII